MPPIDTTAVSRPRAHDLVPGYRLEKLVGRGGMGEVYRATQLSLGCTRAVKLLSSELAKDKTFVARFQKEAAALTTLAHPHIVAIVDKGKAGDTYYLVMEFVDGPSLREVMRSPLFDPASALKMMMEICRAIEYAHGRGVIHRDLKPENILFDEQAGGIPKVSDFGLAAILDERTQFNVTATHMAMGTLAYMAPEQRVDAKSADARADVFSLGVILYELLVGELPMGTFDAPSQRKPGVDPRADEIVRRCLKPDPADRYETVSRLVEALEPLLPFSGTQLHRALSRLERLSLSLRRAVRLAGQVAAGAVVLAAAAVLSVAALRARAERPEIAPGAALTADLGPPSSRMMAGRLEVDAASRRFLYGQGPDDLSLLVAGRPLTFEGRTVLLPPVTGQSRVGRLTVDAVELDGEAARLSALVGAEEPPPSFFGRLRRELMGPPPEGRAALLLLGAPGRYVALVSSAAGSPLALEWALGERRGTMLGQASPEGPTRLELSIDDGGLLRAYAGAERNRRQVAEPIDLGKDWQRHFGKAPVPGFGCIEGTCSAEGLAYVLQRAPPASLVEAPRAPPAKAAIAPAKAVAAKRPAAGSSVKKTSAKAPVRAPKRRK